MKPRISVTFADRKCHAEQSWIRAYQDALNGNVDSQRLGDCMGLLNMVDYMSNRERSIESERHLKDQNVDWDSDLNRSSECQIDLLRKILKEIRGE